MCICIDQSCFFLLPLLLFPLSGCTFLSPGQEIFSYYFLGAFFPSRSAHMSDKNSYFQQSCEAYFSCPIGFQIQVSCESVHLFVESQKLTCQMCDTNALLLSEKLKVSCFFPILWYHEVYEEGASQLLLLVLMCFLICPMCKSCLSNFWISLRGNCSTCCCMFSAFM